MYCSLSHVQHSLLFLIHALIYAMRFLRYCHCSMSTVWWSTVRGRLDSEKCKFQLWAVFFASNIFTAFFLLVETNPWVSLCRTRKYENGLQGEVYFSLFFYNIFYDFLITKVRALIFHNFCGKQVQKMKAHCGKKKMSLKTACTNIPLGVSSSNYWIIEIETDIVMVMWSNKMHTMKSVLEV